MITMDGKSIEDFGFYVEPGHEDPITPNLQRNTMSIPGMKGVWDFGTEIGEKPFAYPLMIRDIYHDDMQREYNNLVAFLFDDFGQPREIKLVRDYEPDKFYMVKIAQQMVPERLTEDGRLVLPFVASDPLKYSNTFGDEVFWGSEVITFEYNYLLGREGLDGTVSIKGPQTLEIPIDGLAVQPIFELNGAANNLTISANGYTFSLPSFTNTRWVIDFESYIVYKNGQETMIDIRDFYLMPGNNQVRVTGSNINIDMRIKFRDKYM